MYSEKRNERLWVREELRKYATLTEERFGDDLGKQTWWDNLGPIYKNNEAALLLIEFVMTYLLPHLVFFLT